MSPTTHLVRPVRAASISDLSEALAPLDTEEVWEATGRAPEDVFAMALDDPNTIFLEVRRLSDLKPICVVGGTPMDGRLNLFLLATTYITLSDMVFLKRNVNAGILNLLAIAGLPLNTEAFAQVWSENTPHVRWCLRSNFYPTGDTTPAPNRGNFLEMIYTCVPPH